MKLPKTYTTRNETGCCAIPNIEAWDNKEITFRDRKFVRMHTKSFLHIPINMSRVMAAIQKEASKAGALMPTQEAMILSRDLSPWKAEQLFAVTNNVPDADNIELSGKFLTMVFEGPYQDAKKWYEALQDFAKSKSKNVLKTYFFYTNCPKCAKHYGKNYTIGLAQIE